MASSSSSSHVPQVKYDVFISFRGSDTRHGFLSHLTKELRQKHIDVYIDERVERGDEISLALVQAIEGSLISLVIFSKGYASSKWCLEELVKIIECKEVNDQIVIPVFYDVDPSDVRHYKGTYGDAFATHELNFMDTMEKLQIWRFALKKAANLSGYHLSSNFENESKFIREIVKDILEKLDRIYPSESIGLVGIDQHLECIESLLEMEAKLVRIVGIWGMGGIGKTTIAQAAFEKFSSQYESCCFLENVREESEKYGLNYLRKKLISELLEEENCYTIGTTKARSTLLKRRLSRKKVLIVLDDVNTPEQLEYLIGEQILWGLGSRIIITSRDKHVLISQRVHEIYEVKEMNFEDSLELFSLNAFNSSHPKNGYVALSIKTIDYAYRIPLALKVLGSFFNSRDIETWESALEKLKKYPNKQIQDVLKVSYHKLDDEEKEIFLDIAFFYKGLYKDQVIRLLNASNFFGACGIDSLLNKALITILFNNRIQMHDLIQEMGWEIVRQECRKDPGSRSRLRKVQEVYDVLKNNKGSNLVEGIMLDVSEIKEVHLSADAFKKMTNLRILNFYSSDHMKPSNVYLPTNFESFSDKLTYFEWYEYPLESLPISFCPENLVELHMPNSCIKKLWNGVQELVHLTTLNLTHSKQLKELPDFSKAHNLKWVDLSFCDSLCHVHPSILSLSSLISLQLQKCKNLRSLQSESYLESLEFLNVSGCSSLKEFSLLVKEIIHLNIFFSSIEIEHSSNRHLSKPTWFHFSGSTLKIHQINEVCSLRTPEELNLSECVHKPMLQIEIHSLHSLQELYLEGYSNFSGLSEILIHSSSLRVLTLKGCCVIESLPITLTFLKWLETLDLSNCKRLQFLPELPESIIHLNANNCTSLKSVFTLTSLLQRDYKMGFLSLINCMELCQYDIMEEAYLLLQPLSLVNIKSASFCYPGSKVPEWFKSNQAPMASITIELFPDCWDLTGFIFCFILSQFISKQKCVRSLKCQWKCYFEDGEEVQGIASDYVDMMTELNSDHVFLLYDQICCREILRGLLDRRRDDGGTSYSQKLSFGLSVAVNGEMDKHDDLIKECGVCPMYLSEYSNFLQQHKKLGPDWM